MWERLRREKTSKICAYTVTGDWKLIDQPGSGGFSKLAKIQPKLGGPKGQLYNLRDDPAETKNLYPEYPDVVVRLDAEMQRIRKSNNKR